MNKTVIYTRVSSKEQAEGFSLAAQSELLRNYAIQRGFCVENIFSDAETAKQEGRTQFTQMLEYIRKNNIKHILVEKTDRLYRNFKDYVLIDSLSDVEIHLVKEGTVLNDCSRSHDKFIHGIKVLMAKNYIDNLKEEISKGINQRVKAGLHPGKVPYGYVSINRKAEIEPIKSMFVKRAYELYSTNEYSLKELSKQLCREGYIYTGYEQAIKPNSLNKILRNKFYIGIIEWKDQFIEGIHEPIIDKDVFLSVQSIINKGISRGTSKTFIYNNLMRCFYCDAQIVGEIKKGKYIYYHCGFKKKTHDGERCKNTKYLSESVFEKQIKESLSKLVISSTLKQLILTNLKSILEEKNKFHDERQASLQKQLKKLKIKQDKLYNDKLDELISLDFFKKQNLGINEQIIHTQKKLESLEKSSINFFETATLLLELLENLSERFSSFKPENKRKLMRLFYSNLILKDGNVDLVYNSTFEILINLKNEEKMEASGQKSNIKDFVKIFAESLADVDIKLIA